MAAADEMKCHPINTWRDEDQELTKVFLLQCFRIGLFIRFKEGFRSLDFLFSLLHQLLMLVVT